MKQKEKRGWSRKRLFGLVLLCLVPLGFVATMAGVGLVWQSHAMASLRAEQDAVREALAAEGQPVTWEDWETRQPVFAEEDNGAPYIVEAIALLKAPPLEDDALLPYVARLETPAAYENYTEESIRAMGAFVAANQPAIDAFLRGVGVSHIHYPAPEGDAEELEEKRFEFDMQVLRLRETVRVATDHAIATNNDEQLWKLIGGKAVAHKLYHDTDTFKIGTTPALCESIERLLNSRGLSDTEITLLNEHLASAAPVAWFRAGLVGDTDPDTMIPEPRDYLLLDPVRIIAAQSPMPDSAIRRIAGRDYEAAKLRTLKNVRDAYHLCEKTWKEAATAIEQGQEAEDTLAKGLSFEMRPYVGMDSPFRARAQLQLTQIALALEAFRIRHGRLPGLLDALVESTPTLDMTDPFDGEPIRYVIQEAGFLLYSVGENLVDDSGATYLKRGDQESKGDIVFELRR